MPDNFDHIVADLCQTQKAALQYHMIKNFDKEMNLGQVKYNNL